MVVVGVRLYAKSRRDGARPTCALVVPGGTGCCRHNADLILLHRAGLLADWPKTLRRLKNVGTSQHAAVSCSGVAAQGKMLVVRKKYISRPANTQLVFFSRTEGGDC